MYITFFDQATIGGDTIIPLSLRLRGINFDILDQDLHIKPSLALLMDRILENLVTANI